MVVRCSLLGHDYGDEITEREREERGSEVVVTIREIQECARCGKTTVVTENKEVTSLEPEPAAEPEPAEAESAGGDSQSGFESSVAEADPTVQDPERDDGVILDDGEEEADEPEREYGQWPERDEPAAADADESGPRAWPEAAGEDEGYAAERSAGEATEVDFGGGLTPEADDAPVEEDAEFIEAVEGNSQLDTEFPADEAVAEEAADDDAGFASAGAAPNPSLAAPPRSDAATDLVCPRCEFVQRSAGSSLRAGDICPDCRRGYLAEQEN